MGESQNQMPSTSITYYSSVWQSAHLTCYTPNSLDKGRSSILMLISFTNGKDWHTDQLSRDKFLRISIGRTGCPSANHLILVYYNVGLISAVLAIISISYDNIVLTVLTVTPEIWEHRYTEVQQGKYGSKARIKSKDLDLISNRPTLTFCSCCIVGFTQFSCAMRIHFWHLNCAHFQYHLQIKQLTFTTCLVVWLP